MNLFFKLWIISRIMLIGLIYLKMDMKNLIKIGSLAKYKEVLTQVDNGIDNVNKHIRVQQGEKKST